MPAPELPSQLSDPAREILHATDFTKESEVALAHALKLALANKATLHMLHVTENEDDETAFPSIRRILERWGTIPAGASRSAVTDWV